MNDAKTPPKYEMTSSGLPADPQLVALADQAAAKYQIPPEVLKSVIRRESDWNPFAQAQGSTAYGLGQLTKAAAQDAGVDPRIPAQNVDGTAKYLRMQYDRFGNWAKALAAYNQGARNVDNAAGTAYANAVLKMSGVDASNTGVLSGLTNWLDQRKGDMALVLLGIIILVVAVVHSGNVPLPSV